MFALGLQSSHNVDLKSLKIIPGKGRVSYCLIGGVNKKWRALSIAILDVSATNYHLTK